MLKLLSIGFFSLLLSLQAIADNFYGQNIYAPQIQNSEYQEALSDLSAYLTKITGKHFTITQGDMVPSKGIVLLLHQKDIADALPSKKLEGASDESFVLYGNKERLIILANHPSGLSKGIYSYLDWLGVKWYFPGEKWEVVPHKNSIVYSGTDFQSPSFSSRNFFGTGGIRSVAPIDANGNLVKEWDDWKRRNRMGGAFSIGGHYGEIFNTTYRKQLEQHPEYLALVNGKRAWNLIAKWCVSNAGFRKLFIEDRVNELKADLESKTYPYSKIVLSVDPSDGAGDCECDQCKKLGTVSERYYFLANEVAKAFAKISPRASVSLLAYNTHASPPSFPLLPNVVVMIIPYAFQNFGTPGQMIDAWTKRHNNIMVYDYYCIPDWHYEVPMPAKTSSDTLVKRLQYWKKKGIKGFQLESVFGTAIAGEGLYLAARLGWDYNSDVARIRKEFLKDMFEGASKEAALYFDYLKQDFRDASSLSYLRSILASAKGKGSIEERSRLSDLEAYLHYLTLYYRWQSAKENKTKSWEELVQYTWEIYPLKIVHSTRIADLFFYQLKEDDALIKDWNIVEPYGKKLNNIRFADEKKIAELTTKDTRDDPMLQGFAYKKTKPSVVKLNPAKTGFAEEERMILGTNFPKTYVMSSASGYIHFSIRMNDGAGTSPIVVKLVDTSNGAVVFSKKWKVGHTPKDISIVTAKNTVYQLVLEYRPWLLLKVPANQWIGFAEIPFYSVMNTLWFYVPTNTDFIYYSNTSKEPPVFKDSGGKIMQPEKVNEQNMFRLRVNLKGGWWNISSSQYKNLKFYSVPDLFFPHSGYTVINK